MNESILVVKQDNQDTYTTDYVVDVFNTSNDLNLIKSVVERADERLYVTWASVVSRDKAGEIIPINDLINSSKILMERGAPIQDSHTNAHVGKTLAYKIMQHPKTQTLGVLQINKIFHDNQKDDEVWNKIKSGEYKGSSVGGFTTGKPSLDLDNNNMLVRTLSGFTQFETSIVKEPCNSYALNEGFSVVAKSSDNINTQEKMEEQKKEETKKASVLESIMAKVTAGEDLSPEEMKALEAAISAAENAMQPVEPQTEETPVEVPIEEQSEAEIEEEKEIPMENPETQEDNTMEGEEDKYSTLQKTISQLIERMDLVEEQISGSINKEETEEEKPMEEEVKEDTTETETSKSEDMEKKTKSEEVVEVVKSERPVNTKNKVLTAYDIATNKAKYNPKTGQIETK